MSLAQYEIVRRIAERGLAYSQTAGTDFGDSHQVDLWQHLLDELERLKRNLLGTK